MVFAILISAGILCFASGKGLEANNAPTGDLMRRESDVARGRKAVQPHVQELLENTPSEEEPGDSSTTAEPKISCGGHLATRCRLCTVLDPKTGEELEDQGPTWCHGDCHYYDGECHTLTSYNLDVTRGNASEGATTTQMIPDLDNPNITDKDREIMGEAAKRSISEADYEAKMRLAAEKKKREEEANTANKFLWGAIMAGSAVMVLCACSSCFMLYFYMSKGAQRGASQSTEVKFTATH